MNRIRIRPGVKMTDIVQPLLNVLDTKFDEADLNVEVVSCERPVEKQLNIIIDKGRKERLILPSETLSMDKMVQWKGEQVPEWQPIWEQLLELNYLIAPLKTVTILTGVRRGQTRNPSDHFPIGCAVDLNSARPETEDNETLIANDRNRIYRIAADLQITQKNLEIRQVFIEPKQNCVHVAVKRPIGLMVVMFIFLLIGKYRLYD